MPVVANTITIEPSNTHERADRKGKKCTAMQKTESPVVSQKRNPNVQLSDGGGPQ